jgi:hypothetical protein
MEPRPARRVPALLAWAAAAVVIVTAGTLLIVIARSAPGSGGAA